MNIIRRTWRLFRKRSRSIEELRLLATGLEREFHDYRDAQMSANARLEAGLSELVAANMAHKRVLSDLHGVFLKMAEAKRSPLDLSRAIVSNATDADLLLASGLFDENWYREHNPDVDFSSIAPVVHFLNVGAAQNQDPGPAFSMAGYLRTYPDVAHSGLNPLVHYLRHGIHEGRGILGPAGVPVDDPALRSFRSHALGTQRLSDFFETGALSLFVEYEYGAGAKRWITKTTEWLASAEDRNTATIAEQLGALERLAARRMPGGEPKVSIIVPVHNQFAYTLACLQSIYVYPPSCAFEIIVGDDKSDDETTRLARLRAPNLKVIRYETNLGFLKNCNATVEQAAGDVVVLLNNDTLVLPGAIDAVRATLDTEAVGAVGGKLIEGDGRLQEAGGIVFRDGSAWNYGRDDDPLDPKYNYRRDADYCSAAALGLRRDVWRELGGFDEAFAPAYYEDTDLCMRVRQAGWRVVYQPRAAFIHFEGRSHGSDIAAGLKQYQAVNVETFRARWRGTLADHGTADPDNLPTDRTSKGRVLVIDAEVPRPDQDSGSNDLIEYFKAMLTAGYRVTFAPENLARPVPYTARLNEMGVEVLHHPYWSRMTDVLREFGPQCDVIVVSRAPVADSLMPLIDLYAPNAKVVFNTVDLHFLRMDRAGRLDGNASLEADARRMRDIEIGLIRRADASIVVSDFEADLLWELVPEAEVETIPILRPEPPSIKPGFDQRKGALFVGGFRHEPNVDGVLWFAREVWPILRRAGYDDGVAVVGSHAPNDITKLSKLGIDVKGHVDDLDPEFNAVRLTIAPIRYGAGLKGKVVQSLSYGVPVVGTTIAVEGSGLRHDENALIADDAEAFAEQFLRLHGDRELWLRLSTDGLRHFRENFSSDVVGRKIVSLLDRLSG